MTTGQPHYLICTVRVNGAEHLALSREDGLVDLGQALGAGGLGMAQLLNEWAKWLPQIEQVGGLASLPEHSRLPAAEAQYLAPIRYPGKLIFAGANYYDHCAEMGVPMSPELKASRQPWFFTKMPTTSIIGPGATIRIPPEVKACDWEAELGAVIGRPARRVSVEQALDYVAGYTIINDVSARDRLVRADQPEGGPFRWDWNLAKGWETWAPCGPGIVPARFIPDPQNLAIKLWVNDELKQNSSTAQMIFTVAEQIAWLSQLYTLEPGDIISTGTPAGVGAPRQTWLKPGDRVTIEIEKVGRLGNPVAAES